MENDVNKQKSKCESKYYNNIPLVKNLILSSLK